jgi:hypothetical protein
MWTEYYEAKKNSLSYHQVRAAAPLRRGSLVKCH